MLKKDIQPRPAYLKWAYIGMMTIAFWNGGLGLPWFTKYVLQVGVLGMALLFMLVTGDFRRLKAVGQFAVMFGLPFVMMAALSMLYWALDFQQLNYMSRGCSTILYHVISLSAMCSAVYLFGRRSIDYTLYGMCGANVCIVLGSIKENGINEPVKARPREGGGLELLSGHRRHDVAMQLNYPVPVVIVQADDDTARIEVVDGNLHRQDIPTSELARAAKMKMEALARKAGRRTKMEQLAGPPPKRTDQQVAEDMGMSRNQVQRLVRIDSLVPELKQQVDDKKLPFNTAVELSYMKPEEQSRVVDFMAREQVMPSMAQATALKEASRQAAKTPAPTQAAKPKVDERQIASIVKPKKEPELRVTFTGPELADYFPKATPTVAEVKRTVFEALDLRKKALERQAKKQEIKDAAKKPAQQGDSR